MISTVTFGGYLAADRRARPHPVWHHAPEVPGSGAPQQAHRQRGVGRARAHPARLPAVWAAGRQPPRLRRLLAALADGDGMTSERLVALLSPDLNKGLVAGVLAELSREGLVRGEKQQDGPYKFWYLT